MSAWLQVAEIIKTKNLEGGLVLCSSADLPFVLEEEMEVFFVPPNLEGIRSARIRKITEQTNATWFVFFHEITSIATAEALVGKHCLVRRSDITIDVAREASLDGFVVQDETYGHLGRVKEMIDNNFQSLLIIEGPQGEVMIPFVDEMLLNIDEEQHILTVRIPHGLLESQQ